MPTSAPKLQPSYVSLFSSGGIGDFGFKEAGFHCVATAELLSRRLEVQRLNDIASPEDLICGDLELPTVFNKVIERAKKWVQATGQPITTILATPPCQGMSVANHKKGDELGRNSLVVKSIEAILDIKPLSFVIENVPAFTKTICTGLDGVDRQIGDEISRALGGIYEFYSAVLPLEEFGSPSKRKRSITIGVRNDVTWTSPLDLFPRKKEAPTLRYLIGHLPSLTEMGQCDPDDPHHSFRPYQERMRPWIKATPEGLSAFDNPNPSERPHRIIDGKVVPNVRKNGDKYRRVPWDSIAPCVHTRNDILASQNTVHPKDDRVFSVRELMLMMGIPAYFKWFEAEENAAEGDFRRHDTNIRQCLGEAIPFPIAKEIAKRIHENLWQQSEFRAGKPKLKKDATWGTLTQKAAYRSVDSKARKEFSAHYTQPLTAFSLVKTVWSNLPRTKRQIKILEPSSGGGTFLATVLQFAALENRPVNVLSVDIDPDALEFQKKLFEDQIPSGSTIDFEVADYLTIQNQNHDLIVGNPPFGRRASSSVNPWSKHPELAVRFVLRALNEANQVAFVLPKALLHADSYAFARESITANSSIRAILDFGEENFPDIKVETIGITLDSRHAQASPEEFYLKSWPRKMAAVKPAEYCFNEAFPSWVIYRDDHFDLTLEQLHLGGFNAWRDRSISRKTGSNSGIKVIRGRNLQNGAIVELTDDYYVDSEKAGRTRQAILNKTAGQPTFLAPNLSYKPRLVRWSPERGIPDGSAAVLFGDLSDAEADAAIKFCNSPVFEEFFRVACNYATRSINLDQSLTFWWGIPKGS